MNKSFGKILRVVAIVLAAMTAAMNLLGGIGTTCAAFFTKNYPPYWVLIKPVDYRWLYQSLVFTTIAIGIAGIAVTIALLRGRKRAFQNTMIVLIIGTVLSAIQFFTSLAVIGKAAPANVKFYTNLVTLVVFLILLIPAIRAKVNFSGSVGGNEPAIGGGAAALVVGVLILSTPMWVGESHIFMGRNWVDLLVLPLYVTGTLLTLGGLALLARGAWMAQEPVITALEAQVP